MTLKEKLYQKYVEIKHAYHLDALLEFRPLKTTHGYFEHNTIDNDRIVINDYIAQSGNYEEMERVLIHECAHAIVGIAQGHGPKWKAMDIQLGGDGQRTHTPVYQVPHKYDIVCPNHGCIGHRDRVRKGTRLICLACKSPVHIHQNY
jgi:predicted SprT family Zn-dependent metalloprotease